MINMKRQMLRFLDFSRKFLPKLSADKYAIDVNVVVTKKQHTVKMYRRGEIFLVLVLLFLQIGILSAGEKDTPGGGFFSGIDLRI